VADHAYRKTVQNGRSQAFRLPKECRFKASKVAIVKLGDAVVLAEHVTHPRTLF